MIHPDPRRQHRWLAWLALLALVNGCYHRPPASLFYRPPPPPAMLGSEVDQILEQQEHNAEASKYVVYQHEFELNQFDHETGQHVAGIRLNEYGEDHVKQIAKNLRQGVPFPVVIERGQTSVKPGTRYRYPIHYNPELDLKRREVVVRALLAMGIPDADQRVVVAPAFAEGFTAAEAEAAYRIGIGGGGRGGGGLGGLGGGFGGGFGGGAGGF